MASKPGNFHQIGCSGHFGFPLVSCYLRPIISPHQEVEKLSHLQSVWSRDAWNDRCNRPWKAVFPQLPQPLLVSEAAVKSIDTFKLKIQIKPAFFPPFINTNIWNLNITVIHSCSVSRASICINIYTVYVEQMVFIGFFLHFGCHGIHESPVTHRHPSSCGEFTMAKHLTP